MSAFLVNENHIAELVKGYYKHEKYDSGSWSNPSTDKEIDLNTLAFESQPIAVAFFLAWANCESIRARYGEESELMALTEIARSNYCADVVTATRDNKDADLSLSELVMMCGCLEYQSREVDNYYNSNQFHILNKIRQCFTSNLVADSLKEGETTWEYVA